MFGNALCNISALSGKHDGLFCSRDPGMINSDCVALLPEEFGLEQSYMMNDLQLWRAELLHEPLTSRGWVLQEEVLAPRTLYFGSRQVLWNCAGFRACETYPSMQRKMPLRPTPGFNEKEYFLHDEEIEPITSVLQVAKSLLQETDPDMSMRKQQQILFDVWTRFVSHYSLRALTFPTDKLLAIAGVSKLFGVVMQDQFVAGLWRQHLMECLLWYVRTKTDTSPDHLAEYRAPSWSWASSDGYIMHAEPFTTPWTVSRALQVTCETVGGDEFGMVSTARLRLQSPYLTMSLDKNEDEWTASCSCSTSKVPRLMVRLDTTEYPGSFDPDHVFGAIIRTTAYRLTDAATGPATKILLAAQGIVLTRVLPHGMSDPGMRGSTATAAVEYRRIGYFALEDRKGGSLTPRWVAPGCGIFHRPLESHEQQRAGSMTPFEFEGHDEAGLKVFEIV